MNDFDDKFFRIHYGRIFLECSVVAALKQADVGIALLSSSPIIFGGSKKATSGKQDQNKETSQLSASGRSAAAQGARRRRGGAAARERDGEAGSGEANASGSGQRPAEAHGFRGFMERAHARQIERTKKMLADAELEQQMQLVRLGTQCI